MTGFSQACISLKVPVAHGTRRIVHPNLVRPFLGHPRLQWQHWARPSLDGYGVVIGAVETYVSPFESDISLDGYGVVVIAVETYP
jgi:hypothetical protein